MLHSQDRKRQSPTKYSRSNLSSTMTQQPDQQQHFIYNYEEAWDPISLDFSEWQKRAQTLTRNMVITQWHTFRTPLVTLGPFGKYIMHSPFLFITSFIFIPVISFFYFCHDPYHCGLVVAFALFLSLLGSHYYPSSNHKLQHSFVVFKLNRDNETAFVTLEKLRKGILFQIAPNFETVRNFASGGARRDVEETDSSERGGFKAQWLRTAKKRSKLVL